VLHTVYFLFKNEFILQNTFKGLQCNLNCALSQRSNVFASLVFLDERKTKLMQLLYIFIVAVGDALHVSGVFAHRLER
jgi:hypothetical protein